MAADCSPVDISLVDFCIPDYIFNPDGASVGVDDGGIEKCTFQNPSCPVVVFINSKSGGQLGGDLLQTYRSLLNRCQVFDLGEEPPDKVLHRLYLNLERFKYNSDQVAIKIYNSLRLIVAGGDGTAGWLLGVVSDLKLTRPPPIATVPLGTGNNLPFSFGWGKKNPGTDSDSVRAFLHQVKNASEMKIDSWHIVMRMKAPKEGGVCEPIAPLELPHSLHAFHHVSNADSLSKAGYHTYRGGFWNYFSMGMDAQVSYAFHSERKLYPEKFKKQIANQNAYFKLGCTQGWFCASLMHDSSSNIAKLTKVKIIKRPGQQWEDLPIPVSIRSIVCLNLPSFSGGLNPWGTLSPRASQNRKIMPAYVDDGLVEIVGFRNAWHGLTLLSSRGHGTRLAQAHRIRFEFHKGVAEETYMRIDGEPWKQPLPRNGETVVVEIVHLGQVSMLSAPNHPSKSLNEEPSTPSTPSQVQPDYDSDEYEEKRKFGAAATFKFPKDIDIAHN